MPVTVVPTSFATVAIETFITELSSVMRNWPDASVRSTTPVAFAAAVSCDVIGGSLPGRPWARARGGSRPDRRRLRQVFRVVQLAVGSRAGMPVRDPHPLRVQVHEDRRHGGPLIEDLGAGVRMTADPR